MQNKEELSNKLKKLDKAVRRDRSQSWCLKLWSEFVRARDENRCVSCKKHERLSAHHICRKSLLPEAKYMTGNGITLCDECHRHVHQGFNGKPDLSLPMDTQNGEKIETLTSLYKLLLDDAVKRCILSDKHYFLSDQVLCKFKLFQSYDPYEYFPGVRLEQAYLIWNSAPLTIRNRILEANGFTPRSEPFLPGVSILYD